MKLFEDAHASWLDRHIKSRTGERKDRLIRGHGHGEIRFLKDIWWPLFGNFDSLHPEFEVMDWRGNPCYLDFAWFPGSFKFNIDVKGYGSHVQRIDRSGYSRELMREMFLQTLGYQNIAIPYDALDKQTELVLSMIRNLLTPYCDASKHSHRSPYSKHEKALIQYGMRRQGPIRPYEAAIELGISSKTAIHYLRLLSEKGKVKPLSAASQRICRYQYISDYADRLV